MEPSTMSRDVVNRLCAVYPGAEVSDPFGGGHDCWKVGGKIFAITGAISEQVSVKTDSIETAQMLIEVGVGQKAPYLHRSWVALPLDADEEELRVRIGESYRLIRASLTKKVRESLPPV
jgi:predicted DNA-binding protein (MmcQ/YjbR family)